jgi:hypothetical protein
VRRHCGGPIVSANPYGCPSNATRSCRRNTTNPVTLTLAVSAPHPTRCMSMTATAGARGTPHAISAAAPAISMRPRSNGTRMMKLAARECVDGHGLHRHDALAEDLWQREDQDAWNACSRAAARDYGSAAASGAK